MKASELRQKTQEGLNSELMESLKEQFVLRMQRSTGQLSNSSEMKKVRRNIARIKTIMSEMQLSSVGK